VHEKIENNCNPRDYVGGAFVKLYIYVVCDTQLFNLRLKPRNSLRSYWIIIYIDWFTERISRRRLLQKNVKKRT